MIEGGDHLFIFIPSKALPGWAWSFWECHLLVVNYCPNVEVVQTLEIFQVTPFIWNLNSPREMIPHNHMFKCFFVPNEYRSLSGLWNLHESYRSYIWWKAPSGSFKSLPPRYTCPPTCFQIACSQTHNPTNPTRWHTISTPLPGCHEKYHALGAEDEFTSWRWTMGWCLWTILWCKLYVDKTW